MVDMPMIYIDLCSLLSFSIFIFVYLRIISLLGMAQSHGPGTCWTRPLPRWWRRMAQGPPGSAPRLVRTLDTWNQLKPAGGSSWCWDMLVPVEHQGCLRLPPIAVGPKHQRGFLQIDSALVCHGVSKEIQSVLVIQDDIGTPQLWDIPTWTGKPGQEQRGCIQANF